MASGITNRGAFNILGVVFRGVSAPANFNLMLATSATAPTADTNVMSELTEVTGGTGYTAGGSSVARNSTDFDTLTEVDASDWSLVQLKDYAWTASGGSISSIRYAVLGDANGTVGSREIWAGWDLGSTITLTTGQTLTIQNAELKLTNTWA
jgi:purine nucleoside permease